MKVALYARFSSDLQRAASIEDQFRNCRKRAESEGWTITATYADAAISGADSARPQYQAMLAAADRREFDVLIVDDLSRLARDQVESERVIRRLEFRGLRLIAVSDGYDSQTKAATRKIQRTVKGLVNEMRLDELREQVHRGLTGQAEKGYWCGGRPYGFRLRPILDPSQTDAYGQPAKIGTKLEINPEQAAIVREIFASYVSGQSCRTIAVELNRRGVPSSGSSWKRKVRRCKGWAGSAVRQMIINPLYTGLVRWNVSQFVRDPDTGKHKRLKRPKTEWQQFRDESLRVVSDDTFERAKERTRVRGNPDTRLKSGYRPKFLLSGLLRCKCGAHFIMGDARAYVCGGRREGACDIPIRVRRDAVEAAVLRSA
jgi:site-specific DNA recombinase